MNRKRHNLKIDNCFSKQQCRPSVKLHVEMICGSYKDVFNSLKCIILFTLIFLLRETLGGCPSVCQCKWRDGKETVTCEDANYIDIPKGLEASTQVLNLRRNRLSILPEGSFIDKGLVNLQKVWMSHCKLRFLEKGAFKKLANLIELDLSDNFLNSVPTEALSDVSGLRNLYLARNNLGSIHASIFTSVPSLVRLDISYNNITTINKYAFKSLTRLEVLKLTGNNLTTLSVNVLKPLVALHGLHVDNNPWHCDCHLRLLRQWLLQRNVAAAVPPKCQSPPRLRSRGWQALGEDEFVCVPLVTAVAQKVIASHGDTVSLACRVETDPNAAVTWLLDNKPVNNTSAQTDQRYKVLELGAPKNRGKVSNLTIAGADAQDQGIYRCVAENKAGRVETNLTLKVSQRIKETALIALDKVFVTGTLLGSVAFIFIVSVISCAVLYDRNKRTRMTLKVISNVNESNSDLSMSELNSQHTLRKINLIDYQIVPNNDSKILTDSAIEKDVIVSAADLTSSSKGIDHTVSAISPKFPLKEIPKTVSFVEMSSHDKKETDPLLKEIYKEASFICTDALTSPQSSLGYLKAFPDLLDLPRHLSTYTTSTNHVPYCTMPRRPKRSEKSSKDYDPFTTMHYPPSFKMEYEIGGGSRYNRQHRRSLIPDEELSKYKGALGSGKTRWASALSLDLKVTDDSIGSGQPPSLPTTPTKRETGATQRRRDYLIDNIENVSMPSHSDVMNASGIPFMSYKRDTDENYPWDQLSFDSKTICAEENKLVEEIRKLRARKEELSKFRPEEEGLSGRLEGKATSGSQAKQFEYYAQQLDRFLQEYRDLQHQLYRMKESCEHMHKKNIKDTIVGKISSPEMGLVGNPLSRQPPHLPRKSVTILPTDNIITTEKI